MKCLQKKLDEATRKIDETTRKLDEATGKINTLETENTLLKKQLDAFDPSKGAATAWRLSPDIVPLPQATTSKDEGREYDDVEVECVEGSKHDDKGSERDDEGSNNVNKASDK